MRNLGCCRNPPATGGGLSALMLRIATWFSLFQSLFSTLIITVGLVFLQGNRWSSKKDSPCSSTVFVNIRRIPSRGPFESSVHFFRLKTFHCILKSKLLLFSVIVTCVAACSSLFQYRNSVSDVQADVDHSYTPTARHQGLPSKDIAQTRLSRRRLYYTL